MHDGGGPHSGSAIGAALAAAAGNVIAEARAALADPALSDAQAVHDFRKAMKRWRALLRLVAPFIGEEAEELRHTAAGIARTLAGARDWQAALDAVADLGGTDGILSPRSVATIRGRLEAIRSDTETLALTPDARAAMTNTIREADAAIARWPLDAIGLVALCRELTNGYRRGRRTIPEEWQEADAVALHELRKRVIIHRYQMDLVTPLWPKLGKVWIGEAQRLREQLGHHHDLAILEGLTAPQAPLARWRSRLAPLIAARQADHVKAARRAASRLFAERPKAFEARILRLWETQTRRRNAL